jgi:hypothetical protein
VLGFQNGVFGAGTCGGGEESGEEESLACFDLLLAFFCVFFFGGGAPWVEVRLGWVFPTEARRSYL